MTSPTHQDSFDKSLDEPKLEGGTALGTTLTYGHDSLAEGDGPSTVADDPRTKAILRKVSRASAKQASRSAMVLTIPFFFRTPRST